MRVVLKYAVKRPGISEVLAPLESNVALFGRDYQHMPCVWLDEPRDGRVNILWEFQIIATGDDVPDGWMWRASMIDGSHVWHLFARLTY